MTDEVRAQLGAMHPALMGGEYLPDLGPDEVEIARLDLASTTGDVTAVLARPEGTEIQYRIVDEYETSYLCAPERSGLPLTLGELVQLLDHARAADAFDTQMAYGLIEGFWERDLLFGEAPEDVVRFIAVSSPFYPALAEYYEGRARDWIATSRRNPLAREAIAALEEAWHRSTVEKRKVVLEFLASHGYGRGAFRKYGARHQDVVLSLLDERSVQGCDGATDPASSAPRHD